ncbi:hypothetical protein B0H14DRAFT_1184087, partial [Mycena olivaceomarginata]
RASLTQQIPETHEAYASTSVPKRATRRSEAIVLSLTVPLSVRPTVHAPSSRPPNCAQRSARPRCRPRRRACRRATLDTPPRMSSASPTLPPASPVCTARRMSPNLCIGACTTPASPTPPGPSLCSPASSCTAPASSSSPLMSLASAQCLLHCRACPTWYMLLCTP